MICKILSWVQQNSEFVKILIAISGGFFALRKWRVDGRVKRSLQFRKLIDDFQSDEKVKQFLYILDDDEIIWFSEEYVGNPYWGPVLDKLLFHMCYVIYLYGKCKIVTKDEFLTVSYMIDRPLLNPQLQEYLYNLKKYAEGKGIQHPYKYLVDYGVDHGLLDSSFKASKHKNVICRSPKFKEYYKKWLESEEKFFEEHY